MNIGIVIPAHNEEKRISNTLKDYSEFFDYLVKQKKLDYQILVVINNTNDRTEEIVKNYSKKNKKIKYLNLEKGGKGYAVITGFKSLLRESFDLIGFVDADMATRPEEYNKLIENIKGYSGIIASRYIKGSKVYPKQTLKRIVSSRLFNFVIRSILFIPYKDTQCGAKIFRKRAISSTIDKITYSKWAFDVEVLYLLNKEGYKIREFPTTWADKEYSKINFLKAGPFMLLGVIRLRLINSPFKIFIRFYDKLIRTVF